MPIVLYDTLTRCKREFQPIDEECVKVYVCGPTVYAEPHIGNARPAVVFDVLVRLLRRNYPKVKYVRNITDVDDKILAAATKSNTPPREIVQKFTRVYHRNMRSLRVERPDVEPKVTDNMDAIIAMIVRLLEEGHAYEVEGHVLFDVTSYESYGELSNRDREGMIAGARVETAPYKRDPADFVLWKPSVLEQAGWKSPWGQGRPGWHIECSAMIKKHLGETIDIHGGGADLIFPHHENECAQSFCVHGKPLSNYWMHNGFVTLKADKISKSEGNVITVDNLLNNYQGETLRLSLLSAHYRKPLNWNKNLTVQSRFRLGFLYKVVKEARGGENPVNIDANLASGAVVQALEDDLNTPKALQELFSLAQKVHRAEDASEKRRLGDELVASGSLLGLLRVTSREWFEREESYIKSRADIARLLHAEGVSSIEEYVDNRNRARDRGDYAKADRMRDKLASLGIILEDRADGTTEWSIGQKVETE